VAKKKHLSKNFVIDKQYQDINDKIYDVEQLITINNIIYGRIEMGISTEKIENTINETRKLAAVIAGIEMCLVALFSLFLGCYLTKQLKVLRTSARKIASGDLEHTITIKTRDEIGEVAEAFNKMISSLREARTQSKHYHEELKQLNTTLEDRVQRRTQKILEQKNELETAYEKLQLAQKQLIQSEKMASIGQLAAGVAHEINNPVAFVKSNLSSLANYINTYQILIHNQQQLLDIIDASNNTLVQEKLAELINYHEDNDITFINEDITTLIEESIKGTERVEEIVKGLKIYSRASDDSMEACNINTCLQDTLKLLNNELKYRCDTSTNFDENLPECMCNRSKIIQVFTNLIVNATQAMKNKGSLIIQTRSTTLHNTPAVAIDIKDTGTGIAPENLSKLFDPFFTTKPIGQGTGLGLSISQGIITDHNGTISVESKVNEGTCFTIVLPIQQP
jgi:C4-dicarboxylate-specific signal transduction histidine kinase